MVYEMPETVRGFYEQWIKPRTFTQTFVHHLDTERFYRFTKSYTDSVEERPIGVDTWLRENLENDVSKEIVEEVRNAVIDKAVLIFGHLIDFHYFCETGKL